MTTKLSLMAGFAAALIFSPFGMREAQAATYINQSVNGCTVEYYYANADGSRVAGASLKQGETYKLFLRYKDEPLGSKCTIIKHFVIGYVSKNDKGVETAVKQVCKDRGDMTLTAPYRQIEYAFIPGAETTTKNFVHVDTNTYCSAVPASSPLTPANTFAFINAAITASTKSATAGEVEIAKIENPFGEKASTVPGIANRVITVLLALIIIAAVIVIIVAGFRMVASGGNPDQIKKAKSAIIYAIVGMVLAFMSFAIVQIVQKLL